MLFYFCIDCLLLVDCWVYLLYVWIVDLCLCYCCFVILFVTLVSFCLGWVLVICLVAYYLFIYVAYVVFWCFGILGVGWLTGSLVWLELVLLLVYICLWCCCSCLRDLLNVLLLRSFVELVFLMLLVILGSVDCDCLLIGFGGAFRCTLYCWCWCVMWCSLMIVFCLMIGLLWFWGVCSCDLEFLCFRVAVRLFTSV